MSESDKTHNLVQKAYGEIARRQTSCCGSTASCCGDKKPYAVPDHPVPEAELGLSCGNPLAFGYLRAGNVVVDLGSGAGKDVFLAAQKVGDAGRAIGVDMTPEMLALARKNAVKFFTTTGLNNVEFRQGHIEHLPIEDGIVDVVISNCVINLSPDKEQVFREAYRVLKPGGRLIVSDIVLNRPLPEDLRDSASLYAACIAGAMSRQEYLTAIAKGGFATTEILDDRVYQVSEAGDDPVTSGIRDTLADIAASITVLAVK